MSKTTTPYELLFRWNDDGQLTGGHVRYLTVHRDDDTGEIVAARATDALPVGLDGAGDFPLAAVLTPLQAAAVAAASAAQAEAAQTRAEAEAALAETRAAHAAEIADMTARLGAANAARAIAEAALAAVAPAG